MAILSQLEEVRFSTDQQDGVFVACTLRYSDDTSGEFATASIAFSGTPTTAGSYTIDSIYDEEFTFDETDTIALIHERLANFINNKVGCEWNATHSSASVELTSRFRGDGYNESDLSTTFVTASGLSVTVTPPSGGVQPTAFGSMFLNFDGTHTTCNIDQSYASQVLADRSAFVGKMRSELTLPTPTEVFTDYDANGNVTQVQMLF